MKNNLWILALVAVLGGTPVFATDRDGGGDVGSNGQGSGHGDEIKGDVGGNGQGSGGGPGVVGEGDVGGNGQGDGTELPAVRGLQFYTAAVEHVKEHTTEGHTLRATSRLLEVMPLVTVKLTHDQTITALSTDEHKAGVLDPRLNVLLLNQTIFNALSKKEKAAVLTHHLTKAAGVDEDAVAREISAAIR